MQTCRQSRLEVGADFGVSLLVNLVTQLLFYGALATAGRSLIFAALVLGLAAEALRHTTTVQRLVAPENDSRAGNRD
jgi:hypothetical protein